MCDTLIVFPLQYEQEASTSAKLRARLGSLEAALESASGMAHPQDYKQQQPQQQQHQQKQQQQQQQQDQGPFNYDSSVSPFCGAVHEADCCMYSELCLSGDQRSTF